MKIIFNIFYYVIITAVLLIGLLLLITLMPISHNFQAKIVQSGSMEPAIMTGSLVVIKPEPVYNVGDVITFGADTKTQVPTSHRIVSISGTGSDEMFTTKGDANDAPDQGQTRLSDIHGKVVLSVPYLGYVLDFARKPLGFVLLVGLPALAVIFDESLKILREILIMRRKKFLRNERLNNKTPVNRQG